MIEVEVKAPVEDLSVIEDRVLGLGGVFVRQEIQKDTYFNAPDRDFEVTDEALRIREADGKTYFTYKGPKQSKKTKTRKEIEFPVHARMSDVLAELGYEAKGLVEKKRRTFRLDKLTIALDEVKNLGQYIEIESANTQDEGKIFTLLEKLGVNKETCTLKSYLELLK
ncbi:MAG: class IV adenylate cyclase [Candidatus Altiarchaeota archaeon]